MTFVVSVVGLDNALQSLDGSRFGAAVQRAVERSGQALRDDTKRLPPVSAKRTGYDARGIPVDSGRMRQSIQSRQITAIAAEIFAPVNYSGYVHDGTSRVPARPFFDWALEAGTAERIAQIFDKELSQALDGE